MHIEIGKYFCRVTPEADRSQWRHILRDNVSCGRACCRTTMHIMCLDTARVLFHIASLVRGNERIRALDAESFHCSH